MGLKRTILFVMILVVFQSCNTELNYLGDVITKPNQERNLPNDKFANEIDTIYDLDIIDLKDYYKDHPVNKSFDKQSTKKNQFFETSLGIEMKLLPFSYDEDWYFMYIQKYVRKCFVRDNKYNSILPWKYQPLVDISFPDACKTDGKINAKIILKNTTEEYKTVKARLFYQNTSYWYPINDEVASIKDKTLQNYYGKSSVSEVTIPAGETIETEVEFIIGMNEATDFPFDLFKEPARTGNYEFMALITEDENDVLFSDSLDLRKNQPFTEVKLGELNKNESKRHENMAYVGAEHFKFVFLDEDFTGTSGNDLSKDLYFLPKEGVQKPLCDTCVNFYFKDVTSENWSPDDFFTGYIKKAPFVKAEFGNRLKNVVYRNNQMELITPGADSLVKEKTFGEFTFDPPFKYGTMTVRAKFSQIRNETVTPNGIVHNLWLYQRYRDFETPDSTNPYHHLVNSEGFQPYEIDFEIWSSDKEKYAWDSLAFINYSIVDYMINPNVEVKPGEHKEMNGYKVDRENQVQLNIPGEPFYRSFFNDYHIYKVEWQPNFVRFTLDGKEVAYIDDSMASIPDKHMIMWIGSVIYQDGTYYSQTEIPFLEKTKISYIDWVKID